MDLPTLVVHYENYAKNFKQTLNELMGFLEFVPGRMYREYFSKKERNAVLPLMKLRLGLGPRFYCYSHRRNDEWTRTTH
eukprot:scaffold30108_cov48-Attheya_sp.AAC.1